MNLFKAGGAPRLIKIFPRDWTKEGFVPVSIHMFVKQSGRFYTCRTCCSSCHSPLEFVRENLTRKEILKYDCPLCRSTTTLVCSEASAPLDVEKEAKRTEIERLVDAKDKPQDVEAEFWKFLGRNKEVLKK